MSKKFSVTIEIEATDEYAANEAAYIIINEAHNMDEFPVDDAKVVRIHPAVDCKK